MRDDITVMVPGFTDLKLQPGILNQLRTYARSMGFKDEEMNDIRDRRILLMVWKAYQYEKILDTIPGQQPGEKLK
jgi:hypothetical protein